MEIPIFPLNGAVLFPETNLPLNIFEERYLEMIDYALSKKRFIGMIQSNENGDLYKVGCLGKITSFNETKDGRYLVNLEGINCFQTTREIKKKYKFRMVQASIIKKSSKNFSIGGNVKQSILNTYGKYIKNKNIDLNISELEKLNVEQISKLIAMVSPLDDVEKQMLLEINILSEFCKKLLSILEIEILDSNNEKTIN